MSKRKVRYLDAAGARTLRGQTQIRFRSPQKKSGSKFGKVLYWLVFLIFVGVIIYALFFSQFLAVTQLNVGGTRKLDPAEVKAAVAEKIAGDWLGFIPKNNILLVSKNALRAAILDRFKYAAEVEILKNFPHQLAVNIRERQFDLVFCADGRCQVMDDRGVAFAEANFATGELGENELPVLYDDGNAALAKQLSLDPDYIRYILELREKIKNNLGIELVREVHTPQLASGDIRMQTAGGWQVYFDRGISTDKEITMLKAVLDNKIGPDQRPDLEYVDLRTDNKVYYKFKTGERQDSSQPAEPDKH